MIGGQNLGYGGKTRSLPMHSPKFDQCGLILAIINLEADVVSLFHKCSNGAVKAGKGSSAGGWL
jgi:hypothetical protein